MGLLAIIAVAAGMFLLSRPGAVSAAYRDLRLVWQERVWPQSMDRVSLGQLRTTVAPEPDKGSGQTQSPARTQGSPAAPAPVSGIGAAAGSQGANESGSALVVADIGGEAANGGHLRLADPESNLSNGAEKPANRISRVQRELKRLGYYRHSVDGLAGPQTRAALRAFQRDRGLQPTGQISRQAEDALKSAGIQGDGKQRGVERR